MQAIHDVVQGDGADEAEVEQAAHVQDEVAVQVLGDQFMPFRVEEHLAGQWDLTVPYEPEKQSGT